MYGGTNASIAQVLTYLSMQLVTNFSLCATSGCNSIAADKCATTSAMQRCALGYQLNGYTAGGPVCGPCGAGFYGPDGANCFTCPAGSTTFNSGAKACSMSSFNAPPPSYCAADGQQPTFNSSTLIRCYKTDFQNSPYNVSLDAVATSTICGSATMVCANCSGIAGGSSIRVYFGEGGGIASVKRVGWAFNVSMCNTEGCNSPASDKCAYNLAPLVACSPGYQIVAVDGSCAYCPPGYSSPDGTYCSPCPSGTYSNTNASSHCTLCNGYVQGPGAPACIPLSNSPSSSATQSASASALASPSPSASLNASPSPAPTPPMAFCAAGTIMYWLIAGLNDNSPSLCNCPPGMYLSKATYPSMCQPCPMNTYSTSINSLQVDTPLYTPSLCTPCSAGTMSPVGSSGCTRRRALLTQPATTTSPTQLLQARTTVHGGLLLTADLWLTLPVPGASPLPVQRGIPTSSGQWFIPSGVGDSRPGMGGALPTYTVNSTHPYMYLGLSGIFVAINSATWGVRGMPSASLLTAVPSATEHVLTYFSNTTSLLIPAGVLRGGYIYAATVTLSVSAKLAGPASASYVLADSSVDSGWSALTYSIPTLLPATAYVHLPPQANALNVTLSPSTGAALSTLFSFSASPPNISLALDAAARATDTELAASLGTDAQAIANTTAVLLVATPGLPSAAALALAIGAADPANASSLATLYAASTTLAAAAANVSSPSQCVSASTTLLDWTGSPAWLLILAAQTTASSLLRSAATSCPALEYAAAGLGTRMFVPSGALPLVPAADRASFSWTFRIVSTGSANTSALTSLSGLLDAAAGTIGLDAVSAAQATAASSSAGWLGSNLQQPGPSTVSNILLPLPGNGNGTGGWSWVLAYGVDSEGAVGLKGLAVYLSGLPVWTAATVASSASAFVANAVAFIPNATANPSGALTAISSLSVVLAASTAATANTSTLSAAQVTELSANNSALRGTLMASVSSAVSSIAASGGTTASSIAGAALALGFTKDTAGVAIAGGVTFNRVDFTSSEILTLSQTTAVPLDDSTANSAITTMASLVTPATSGSSATTSATALSSLSTVLLLSLPTNVLLGLSDAAAHATTTDSNGTKVTTAVASAGLAALPASTGAAALSVLATVLQGAGETTGGNASSLRVGALSTFSILSAALLRAAAPGDPSINVSSGSAGAFSSSENASYCAADALTMTSQRLATTAAAAAAATGGVASVELSMPIAPCNNASATDVYAAISLPAPSVSVPLAALAVGANISASRDVLIVQSSTGALPMANISAALSSASSFASAIVQPNSAGVYRSIADANSASLSLLRPQVDLKPKRGADSRDITITVTSSNGVVVPVSNTKSNVTLTIPPTSATAPSAAIAAAAADTSRLAVRIVCPLNITVATSNGGNATNGTAGAVLATHHYASSSTSLGVYNDDDVAPPTVTGLVSGVFAVGDTITLWGRGVRVPSNSSAAFVLAALANTTAQNGTDTALFINVTAQLLPHLRYYSGGRVVSDQLWRLELDCGSFRRNFTCGLNGTAGLGTTLFCPKLIASPTCGWWNESARAWSTYGCVASSFTATGAVVCSCNHLTDFAMRFESLADSLSSEFELTPPQEIPAALKSHPYVIYLVSAVMGTMAVALAIAFVLDRQGDARFFEALSGDEEVAFLRRIELARGGEFILDRHLDGAKTAPWWRGDTVDAVSAALMRFLGNAHESNSAQRRSEGAEGGGGEVAAGKGAGEFTAARSGALARIAGELTDARRKPANVYTTALYFQLALRMESMRVSASRLTSADLSAANISPELARAVVLGEEESADKSAAAAIGASSSSTAAETRDAATSSTALSIRIPGDGPMVAAERRDSVAVVSIRPPPRAATEMLARRAALVESVRDKLMLLDSAGKSRRTLMAAAAVEASAALVDGKGEEKGGGGLLLPPTKSQMLPLLLPFQARQPLPSRMMPGLMNAACACLGFSSAYGCFACTSPTPSFLPSLPTCPSPPAPTASSSFVLCSCATLLSRQCFMGTVMEHAVGGGTVHSPPSPFMSQWFCP